MKMKSVKLAALFLSTFFLLGSSAFAAPVEVSLADSVSMALAHSRDIKLAEIAKEKAIWAVKQAEANKGVSLDFSHTDKHYSSPTTIGNSSGTNRFDNQLSVSYPLYSGGKLEGQIRKAGLDVEIADAAITVNQQQIQETVTTCYYNLLQYQKELEVNKEMVDNYKEHLRIVENQYEIGTVAKADVLASQVELADAEDTLIQTQKNYQVALAQLNDLLGLSLDSQLQLKEALTYEKNNMSFEECVQEAMKNRPELIQYLGKIASAQEDIKIAESGKRPNVSLGLSQSWYDKELLGFDNGSWQVSLTTSWNLFDSGLTQSQRKQSEKSLESVKEEERQKREAIVLEVKEAYLGMREAEKRIGTKKAAIEQAQESLKIAEARYQVGMGTNLAVFDAVVALNKAKINDIKALYDYNNSKAQLEKAIGSQVHMK